MMSFHDTPESSSRSVRSRHIRNNAPAGLGLIEWLTGDECHALDEASLVSGLGRRLQALGLPVDRLSLHLTTLHPEFVGRTFAWAPGEPIEIHDREHASRLAFANTPLLKAQGMREPLIVGPGESPHGPWQHIDIFAERKLVQLLIAPLCNADGPISTAVFATRRPGGFSVLEQDLIERIVPALRNACELRVLRQCELSLLDTYIGPMTASRILAGHIRRGDIESIKAALLLCDLRGFTELSNQLPGTTVIGLLNSYFEKAVPAITREGGEVLKFMGDAVLAFFPNIDAARACDAALVAAKTILAEIETFAYEGIRIKVGIALHYGEVRYGNVGSGSRMDFTLIGPDVNIVSRIQGICSESGKELLMSGSFRENACLHDAISIGPQKLKGLKETLELYAMAG
ncbi:adenylate/guanylate cyclase domain-containing protein [Oryzifoliimicrobium ureilyticus]|uniref:adenylate/guanylate cyclase domain-containing protein n=1 Tax=Oryzifoliimicrobium ureilyticus TaxID=3113724 RepID=UPI003076121F